MRPKPIEALKPKPKGEEIGPDGANPPEEIDLRPLYPSYEYFDENGKPITFLRGMYETGSGDNKLVISAIEFDGYRNFKKKVKWVTLAELTDFSEPIDDVTGQPVPPRPKEKGGHTTIYGHEWVPTTKINKLLTQNPVIGNYIEDGDGEDKVKHYSPTYHPISFDTKYKYWDESNYLKLSGINDTKSLDCYDTMEAICFKCDVTGCTTTSHIVYHNPNNNQLSVWCDKCFNHGEKWPWHPVTDRSLLEEIGFELGLELVRYKKPDDDEDILGYVRICPGINVYEISKKLDMNKAKVQRGIDRLKERGLVRTRTVGRSIRCYPIRTDLLY
jgi:hypothetical protein